MSNYSLVVNSRFSPFSYQEILSPALMATQAHQELENQYGELATKANVWEEMANEQTDPYAYKMYKTYANDLEEQAGQLAREGLNTASRRDMLNMRARYSKEITPIEQAYTARQKQAEQQQQALLQDPTLMLSRRAATTSLDDYIRNPQLAYESYSGKLITAQAASAASALAKEMQEKPRKWRSILGNSYYETMMQKGFSSQAVLQAIQDNPNAAPQLTKIVEDAVNSSGVRNWGDQATIARAIDYAKQGLWSAVGETTYQNLENWRAKLAAEAQAKAQAAGTDGRLRGNLPIDIHHLLSPNQEGNEGTKMVKDLVISLGLSPSLTGKHAAKAERTLGKSTSDAYGIHYAKNRQEENKFQWFDSKGFLIQKSLFVNQGKGKTDRDLLSKEYDRVYAKIKSITPTTSRGYLHVNDISKALNNIRNGAGAYSLGSMRVSFKDDGKVLEKLMPVVTNGDNTVIKEVESFDKNGKIKDTGKIIKKEEFIDDDGKLKGVPAFFATPNANTDGIFMKFNGKTYLIPRNKLGSLSNTAYNIDVPTLDAAQKRKKEWIKQYGEDAYYSSKAGQTLEQIINNSGADYLRAIYNTLGWAGKNPEYDVQITSESQIP